MDMVLINTKILQKLLIESAYYRILRENTSEDNWGNYFGELLSNYNNSRNDWKEFMDLCMNENNNYIWSFDDMLKWDADKEIQKYQRDTENSFNELENKIEQALEKVAKKFSKDLVNNFDISLKDTSTSYLN